MADVPVYEVLIRSIRLVAAEREAAAVETESVLFGEVLDVGDECSEAGVAKGSHIVFTEYAATQVDAADGEVCFVRGDDILAVLS